MIDRIIARLEANIERFEKSILSGGMKEIVDYKVCHAKIEVYKDALQIVLDAAKIDEDSD